MKESNGEERLQSRLIYLIASPGLQPGFNVSPSGTLLAWKQKEKQTRKEREYKREKERAEEGKERLDRFPHPLPLGLTSRRVLKWNSLRIIFTSLSPSLVSSFPPPSCSCFSTSCLCVCSFFSFLSLPPPSSACLLLNLRAKLLSSTINRTSRMRILANDANMPLSRWQRERKKGKGEKRYRVRLLLVFYRCTNSSRIDFTRNELSRF